MTPALSNSHAGPGAVDPQEHVPDDPVTAGSMKWERFPSRSPGLGIKSLAQQSPRAMQPGLDILFADVEHHGRVTGIHVLDVAHHEDGAINFGKRRYGLFQQSPRFQ